MKTLWLLFCVSLDAESMKFFTTPEGCYEQQTVNCGCLQRKSLEEPVARRPLEPPRLGEPDLSKAGPPK
jgi:hypothetical protein